MSRGADGTSVRRCSSSERATGARTVSIDIESLKSERDRLKSQLREVETKQRTLEAELKTLRQSEIRSKREIEALSTLIELNEPKAEPVDTTSPA